MSGDTYCPESFGKKLKHKYREKRIEDPFTKVHETIVYCKRCGHIKGDSK